MSASPVDTAPGPGRSSGRAVATGTSWQLASFLARLLAGVVAAILVARAGGPVELGVFQLALNVAGLLSFLVGFGLPNLIAREVARDRSATRAWLESVFLASLVSGTALTLLFGVLWFAVGGSSRLGVAFVLALAATTWDACARQLFAAFWGWERMHLETVATWAQELAFLALTVAALRDGGGATEVLWAYLASRLVGAVVGWALACRLTGGALRPSPRHRLVRPILRRAVPFALDDMLSMAYVRIDTVLLGGLKGSAAVGFYQAGTNLVLNANVLARMLNATLLPRMSRSWASGSAELARLRDLSLRTLAALGVPATVGAVIVAGELIRLVYGPAFDPAVGCFQLLALVIPVRMVGHTLGTALTAVDAQTARTWAVAVAAVGNVALNLALIPRWSYLGAAWATVATEIGLLAGYALLLRRRIGPSAVLAGLPVPAAAAAAMAGVLVLCGPIGLAGQLTVGVATYVAAFLGLLALTRPGVARTPRALLAHYLWGAS